MMRKSTILIAIISIGSLSLSSCAKDDDTLSADDAASVIGFSLSSQDGATAVAEADITGQQDANMKTSMVPSLVSNASTVYSYESKTNTKDTTKTWTDGSRTWTYTRSYTLTKKLKIATTGTSIVTTVDSIVSSHNYSGTFTGPKMTSSHKGSSNAVFTDIGTYKNVNLNWTLNGSYTRTGTSTLTASGKVITYTTQITLINVSFNHKTKTINSGSATVSVSGTNRSKDYAFTGTIIFNNDSTAKLEIGGKTYTINLNTGELK